MRKVKILLIEDDKSLGPTLAERLIKEKYDVCLSPNLNSARKYLEDSNPDLIILDVGLPDGNGFDFAKSYLQKVGSPPFLFLTALSGAEERLKGYELGADEFIPKPFHLKELLLRVNHVLKMHKREEKEEINSIRMNGYTILLNQFEILSPTNEKFTMSKKECELLKMLIQNKGIVLSRDEILNKIWGEDKFPTNRTIDNSIVRLRQFLGDKGNVIQSVRGVGYKWAGEIERI
jgi:DNA-binding response OmpR family regulator